MQGYVATLIESQGDGSALANSTTATSILPAAAKWVMPSGFFAKLGDKLQVRAHGRISTLATTPGTLTLELRVGSVAVASSGAMVLNTSAKTNVPWSIDWDLTLRALGATGNFMHQGRFLSEAVVGAASGVQLPHGMPAAAPAVGSNFDTMAAAAVDLFATWQTANAANSIQCHQFWLISP